MSLPTTVRCGVSPDRLTVDAPDGGNLIPVRIDLRSSFRGTDGLPVLFISADSARQLRKALKQALKSQAATS